MEDVKYLDLDGLQYFADKMNDKYVQKNGNKVLSDNNFTDEAKAKVAGMTAIPNAVIDTIFR